ncbi:MAG: hypothetical protein AAF447_26875 [Myxococcota bacterium]
MTLALRFAFTAALVGGLLAAAGTGTLLEPAPAEAQRLRAQVLITQHRIPRDTSERGLLRFARSHRARNLRETTDENIAEREWRANMVTSFNRPVGDLEFQVLFYELEGNNRRFLGPPLSTMISDRDQKTFLQRLRLERPRFKPDTRYELVVVVRRQEVGRARFETRGEEVRHTGEVNF